MASRLLGLFRNALKRYPLATNTAVYATFYSAAEISQQTFNKYYTVGDIRMKINAFVIYLIPTLIRKTAS